MELSNDFIAMAGLDQHVMYVNAAGRALVGIPPDADVTKLAIADFLSPAGLNRSLEIEQPAVREFGYWQGESTLRNVQTDEEIDVSINSYLVVHPDSGEPLALATVQRDVRAAKQSEHRQRVLASLSNFAIANEIEDIYPRAVTDLKSGLSTGEVTLFAERGDGEFYEAASTSSDAPELKRSLITLDAASISSDRSCVVVPVLGRTRTVGAIVLRAHERSQFSETDVQFALAVTAILTAAMARHLAEMQLRFDALHDHLTGLPNRALMFDRLQNSLSRSARSKHRVAVILLDLDHFKMVNDSFGHETGDALLRSFASRLRKRVRASDTVARLGGDEFVIVCEDVASETEAVTIAREARSAFSEPFEVHGERLFVAASMGIALSPAGGTTSPAEMLREADTAMYRAKRERLGAIEIYTAEMHASVVQHLQRATALQEALESHAVFPVYQVIVSCKNGEVTAVEALARWREGNRVISAAEFIETAEETGLIVTLGRQILQRSCNEVAALQRRNPDGPRLALRVNVSGRQLVSPTFVSDVVAALENSELDPTLLGLEITEAVLIDDHDLAQRRFRELTDLGVQLLLDDFGTGYSSLSYLRNFGSIGALKIDRSFVKGVHEMPADETIVKTVASLGHAFGMDVIAEGVETREHYERICALGCDYAQGYYNGMPLGIDALEEFVFASSA